MNTPTLIQQLFNAGAHFGFSKSRRHPSVGPYLFGTKQGTDIFDLEKTSALLSEAIEFVRTLGEEGKTVLFVSTKTEVSDIVRACADRANMPFVTNRWIGGILTNWSEIKKRLARLASFKEQSASGELDRKYTKKEKLMMSREADKLEFNFGGISRIERTPDALIVVDPRHDKVAVTEANNAKVPVIALMCSDCDMAMVTKPVLGNDSHRASVTLIMNQLTDALIDGRSRFTPKTTKPAERTPVAA
jgi:small subunit ribosomal protein S2